MYCLKQQFSEEARHQPEQLLGFRLELGWLRTNYIRITGMGWWWDISFCFCFLNSLTDSNEKPMLRITGLMLPSKKHVLGWVWKYVFSENNPDDTDD